MSAETPVITGIVQPGLEYVDDPHGYLWKGRPERYVTGVLADLGLTPKYRHVDPTTLQFKCELGKAFHHAARLHAIGDLDRDSIADVVKPYFEGLLMFELDSKATPIAAEVSRRSELHSFCTTIDSVWRLNGLRTLVEYKTGQSVHDSVEYQLWGQEVAWNEYYPNQPIEQRCSLHLKPTGKYSLKEWSRRSAYNFTSFLFTWDELKRMGGITHV